jgi:ribokinase
MGADIVIVGSLNADLCVQVPRFPARGETITGGGFTILPGGKGANQACAAGRLGGHAAMVGQVGPDAQAEMLLASLRYAGVDVSLVATDDSAATGVALITVDHAGENQIVLAPGANGTFTPDRLAPAEPAIRAARVVLLQLEVPMGTVARAAAIARAAGVTVILDPAPAVPLPDDLLALADYLTPNEGELALLADGAITAGEAGSAVIDAQAGRLRARGCRSVLVKLGARGARLVTADGAVEWPAVPVRAVDTTAAGDAFNGALAVALAEGHPIGEAVRFATVAAAISVTRPGAQPSMPTRDEVEARGSSEQAD